MYCLIYRKAVDNKEEKKMSGDNDEIYFGLPKIEGLCLLVPTYGKSEDRVSKNGKDYTTNVIEGLFEFQDGGTTHFGKHKFDIFGDDGKFLTALIGKPVLVDVYKKAGSGYSNLRIVGQISDWQTRAAELVKKAKV